MPHEGLVLSLPTLQTHSISFSLHLLQSRDAENEWSESVSSICTESQLHMAHVAALEFPPLIKVSLQWHYLQGQHWYSWSEGAHESHVLAWRPKTLIKTPSSWVHEDQRMPPCRHRGSQAFLPVKTKSSLYLLKWGCEGNKRDQGKVKRCHFR